MSLSPRACSGDMYAGVPMTSPICVFAQSSLAMGETETAPGIGGAAGSDRRRASPQSITSTSPNSPVIRFSGLRSRWTTPRSWA